MRSSLRVKREAGFSYVVVLIALVIFGLGTAAVGPRLADVIRRDEEESLVEAASAIVMALEAYYRASPTAMRQYPEALEALVEDRRFVGTRRYLRRIPFDPMTRSYRWGLSKNREGRIVGVHSLSDRRPIRQVSPPGVQKVELVERYDQWVFMVSQDNKGSL